MLFIVIWSILFQQVAKRYHNLVIYFTTSVITIDSYKLLLNLWYQDNKKLLRFSGVKAIGSGIKADPDRYIHGVGKGSVYEQDVRNWLLGNE